MQTIIIAGRLGRDAELRETQSGPVCGFTVAVDFRNGRDKGTNWYRVSLRGKRGESLAQYLTKGASVTVCGEFSLGEYDGKPQLNIRANEISLQGGRSDSGQGEQRRTPDGSRGAPPPADTYDDLDSDIPFARNDTVW